MRLRGTYTALVTPFTKNGEVDYRTLKDIIEIQVKAGVEGIVPVGTTGESPTLDFDEHSRVIEACIEDCRGRIQVIAGTGANSTEEAIDLTQRAKKAGADATLQVTPYYNRPSQEGLVRHFSKIADIGLPVVLYNIPGRTGREIEVQTVAKLAKHRNIIGIKEAAGSVDRVSAILDTCDLTVISGDDSMTLPMMSVGATGVISVASNVAPSGVARMVRAALDGRWSEARKLHRKYYRLFRDLFIDTNPVPVKTAMAMMGLIDESFRLPLCPMAPALKTVLKQTLRELKII